MLNSAIHQDNYPSVFALKSAGGGALRNQIGNFDGLTRRVTHSIRTIPSTGKRKSNASHFVFFYKEEAYSRKICVSWDKKRRSVWPPVHHRHCGRENIQSLISISRVEFLKCHIRFANQLAFRSQLIMTYIFNSRPADKNPKLLLDTQMTILEAAEAVHDGLP